MPRVAWLRNVVEEIRENEGNQRWTYTQQKKCTFIIFLISTTSYKVTAEILSLTPCLFCMHITSPGQRDRAFPAKDLYCQKECESLLEVISHIPLFLPRPQFQRTSLGPWQEHFSYHPPIWSRDPQGESFLAQGHFSLCKKKNKNGYFTFHSTLTTHVWIQYYNNSFHSFNQ